MLSILGFLVILGPLVIFHELGHYFFARLFGVKAEVFSVGFGPRLLWRKWGETEVRLSAIPLGGYVKLLGAEPDRELSPEELPRSLNAQAPWKRFLIFFGGPLFNLILAIFVFMAILVIGEPQVASVIGYVVPGSPAEQAGFRPGDLVLSVDGKPVRRYEELLHEVGEKPGRELNFEVMRRGAAAGASLDASGEKKTLKAKPSAQDGFSQYGEVTEVGELNGILPMSRSTVVGISNPGSSAGLAGIKTGDKIELLNGSKLVSWENLIELYAALPDGAKLDVTVATQSGKKITLPTMNKQRGVEFSALTGLHSSEMFVEKTVDASPARESGLTAGDRIVSVDGQAVPSFFLLRERVQELGAKNGKLELAWERDGKIISQVLSPTATVVKDPILRKTTQYTVGVLPQLVWSEPAMIIERVWNPFLLVIRATERMVDFSYRNLVSIGKMFTGDVSVNSLGGPILIGKIAGESLARGLIAFLTTLGVLSVSLGVLNLLPIPVLDGGHLLLLGIEMVRGKPLSLRQMEIIQQVGLSLILLLMVIVMRNDLARIAFID